MVRRAASIVAAATIAAAAPRLVAAATSAASAPAAFVAAATNAASAPAASVAPTSAPRLVAATFAAPATTPDDPAKAAARKAAEAGAAAFAVGDFAGALARFEEAMALRPNPKLHYNLGVCHQRLTREAAARGDQGAEARHAAAAIDAFNAYLRDNPDAADRVAVETLVQDLGGTPSTRPRLRDPLAPLPVAPTPASTSPGPLPKPYEPPDATAEPPSAPITPPAPIPPTAPAPEPPLPRGYLGAATGLVAQPGLVDTPNLDGAYQGMFLVRGGARLGKRRGLELGAQIWLALPGQTDVTRLALSTQALILDVGHAVRLGPNRRLELPLGLELGLAREGLRVRTGQPLPACAAHTSGTLVSARPGGMAGGRLGLAVLVGPRRNHEIGMHIHLAFLGFGPGSAATSCDERPFAAAGVARTRLVLSTSLGYAFRF